jgi:hypothetical protein
LDFSLEKLALAVIAASNAAQIEVRGLEHLTENCTKVLGANAYGAGRITTQIQIFVGEERSMKISLNTISAALVSTVVAFGLIAPALHAGPALGKFKLPFDAKVGAVVLPTGDYTFSLDGIAGTEPKVVVVHQGTKVVGMLVPQLFDGSEKEDKTGELVCIRHDGKVGVRALRTNLGTFYFSLPKDLQVLVTQQPQLIETVPIEASGD